MLAWQVRSRRTHLPGRVYIAVNPYFGEDTLRKTAAILQKSH